MEATIVVLGSLVRDQVSGFEGIAVSRTEYLNGDVKIGVQAHNHLEQGLPVAVQYFDVELVEYVSEGLAAKIKKRRLGF